MNTRSPMWDSLPKQVPQALPAHARPKEPVLLPKEAAPNPVPLPEEKEAAPNPNPQPKEEEEELVEPAPNVRPSSQVVRGNLLISTQDPQQQTDLPYSALHAHLRMFPSDSRKAHHLSLSPMAHRILEQELREAFPSITLQWNDASGDDTNKADLILSIGTVQWIGKNKNRKPGVPAYHYLLACFDKMKNAEDFERIKRVVQRAFVRVSRLPTRARRTHRRRAHRRPTRRTRR